MNEIAVNVNICPISQRDIVACTHLGYRRKCAELRTRLSLQTGGRFDYCGDGAGAVAAVVKDQGVSIKVEGNAMGYQKKWFGKCEACEQEKTVSMHFEKAVCSVCMAMRGVAKNNPQAVIAALREFGNWPEGEGSAGVGGVAPDEMVAENQALKEEIASLKEDLAEYMRLVNGCKAKAQEEKEGADIIATAEISELKEKLAEKEHMYVILDQRNTELDAEVTDLRVAFQRVQELNDGLQKYCEDLAARQVQSSQLPEFSVDRLRTLAWKLADGVISGTISGVTVDDIRILREAA